MSLNNFDTVWAQIDVDGNGKMNREEFKAFLVKLYDTQHMEVAESAINDGWKIVAKKQVDGEVTKEDVKKYCNLLFSL
jgi:hypothetical protein